MGRPVVFGGVCMLTGDGAAITGTVRTGTVKFVVENAFMFDGPVVELSVVDAGQDWKGGISYSHNIAMPKLALVTPTVQLLDIVGS
jgi:hypothetical protein